MDRSTGVFAVACVAAGTFLLTSAPGSAAGLAVAILSFSGVWLISLRCRNAGIVDVFWGPGFVVVGGYYLLDHGISGFRGPLLLAMVSVWAVRLSLHIGIRNAGRGEDFRYAAWRDNAGPSFWWVSYFKVFVLQAVVLWIVSSPLLLALPEDGSSRLSPFDVAGLSLWLFGFVYESVADLQLTLFKSDPANRGKIMTGGLWSLSRHPNYFGEAVLWWGIGLVSLSAGGWFSLVGPALLTYSLVKVSGVAMLDAGLVERRPGYAEYVRSTPAFFPLGRAGRRLFPHTRGA